MTSVNRVSFIFPTQAAAMEKCREFRRYFKGIARVRQAWKSVEVARYSHVLPVTFRYEVARLFSQNPRMKQDDRDRVENYFDKFTGSFTLRTF